MIPQAVENAAETNPSVSPSDNLVDWSPPPDQWKKCDIGVEWDKRNQRCGAAWLVRDHKGVVLFHSRCSFTNIPSLREAQVQVWVWAIESMRSLGFSKIVFVGDSKELVGAVIRPPAWPSFRWMSKRILSSLQYIPEWKLEKADRSFICGAYHIAQSVVVWDLPQSYVATSYPSWLVDLFGYVNSSCDFLFVLPSIVVDPFIFWYLTCNMLV
ncbi:hypothetical protein F2Q69_00030765 [Brassica cretica]|uniref:RNase H type-1 domain-containing protein n=1 Tax=Brassica cretica TaxID=69181 RepID=A0A8S9RR25_BRACR|nr:hypothetical protein F2Q69_00030765 [Brassica cretica]